MSWPTPRTPSRQQLSAQESPPHLARRAVAMGMVPAPSAAFLRLSDGKVVGVAKKATADEGFTVVSQTQAPSGSGASAAGGTTAGGAAPSTTDQSGAVDSTTPATTR